MRSSRIAGGLVTLVATMVLTAPIAYLSFGLNLIVHPYVGFPLGFGFTGVVAGVVATWIVTGLRLRLRRPAINIVVAGSLTAGIALGTIALVSANAVPIMAVVVLPGYVLICAAAAGLAVTQSTTGYAGRSILLLSAGWLAGAVGGLIGIMYLASLAGWTGA